VKLVLNAMLSGSTRVKTFYASWAGFGYRVCCSNEDDPYSKDKVAYCGQDVDEAIRVYNELR